MLDTLDKFIENKMSRIEVPEEFRPHICVDYPKNNKITFEEWFYQQFKGCDSDRLYLGVFWTSYHVNNNYGQDKVALYRLQSFIDSLDRSKKYHTNVQYDDCCLIDFKDLDILVFGMARRLPEQRVDYFIPLMGQPNPYAFTHSDTYLCNFVGSITHPIRERMINRLKNIDRYYISTNYHDSFEYCNKIAESTFTLCPRGYSATSFRVTEALEFGSIPVFISDTFIVPHNLDFNTYGVMIHEKDIENIPEILGAISKYEISKKREVGSNIYRDYYTYDSNKEIILKCLTQ